MFLCSGVSAPEIEFIVIPQKGSPLRMWGNVLRCIERFGERAYVRRGGIERIKQMLIDVKVEHHMHTPIVVAEILLVFVWQNIRFTENDAVAFAPLQKIAHVGQIFKVQAVASGLAGLDQEGNRVQAEAGAAHFEPESHDALDFGSHCRIFGVEVRLETR